MSLRLPFFTPSRSTRCTLDSSNAAVTIASVVYREMILCAAGESRSTRSSDTKMRGSGGVSSSSWWPLGARGGRNHRATMFLSGKVRGPSPTSSPAASTYPRASKSGAMESIPHPSTPNVRNARWSQLCSRPGRKAASAAVKTLPPLSLASKPHVASMAATARAAVGLRARYAPSTPSSTDLATTCLAMTCRSLSLSSRS
mmetsp:Transcript_30506/g.76368  ORF Transcript_30506/g.76368 Transcript_30506/m.76368 type:complete len:200 (+) Transcript_30506:2459-3058(+)